MSSMSKENAKRIVERLGLIKESISIIELRAASISSAQEFLTSFTGMMIFDACVMRLQVIGEEVGALLKNAPDTLHAYPEIPWRKIHDMRNLIAHEYANVDEDIVFDVIRNELPQLSSVINNIIAKISDT